jgi:hypothetical protein
MVLMFGYSKDFTVLSAELSHGRTAICNEKEGIFHLMDGLLHL